MGFFNNFPYTNFHEINLDWILNTIKDIPQTVSKFTKEYKEAFAEFTKKYKEEFAKFTLEYKEAFLKQNAEVDSKIAAIQRVEGDPFRNCVMIGDSFLTGFGLSNTNDNFGVKLAELLGCETVQYFAGNGLGFVKTPSSGTFKDKTFSTAISDIISTSVNSPDLVTSVILIGGFNDADFGSAEIAGGISSSIANAHGLFPNAQLYIIMSPSPRFSGNDVLSAFETVAQTAPGYAYIKTDSWKWMWAASANYVQEDYIHPSAEGHKLIANHIFAYLRGYGYEQTFYYTPELTNATSATVAVNNGVATIRIVAESVNFSGSLSLVNLPRPFWLKTDLTFAYFNSGVMDIDRGIFNPVTIVKQRGLARSISINATSLTKGRVDLVVTFDPITMWPSRYTA